MQNKFFFGFFLIGLILLFICPSDLKATVLPVTPQELSDGADTICVAEVKNIDSYWVQTQQGDRWIESKVHLKVLDYLKRNGPTDLIVQTIGGKVEGITETNSVSAWFDEGERVVVFLKENKGQLFVYKNFLGKYSVTDEGTIKETGDSYDVFIDKIESLISMIRQKSKTK